MDIKFIAENIPPWEYPESLDEELLKILPDDKADEEIRLIAIELAGDYVVMNDKLAEVLLSIICNSNEPDKIRAQAAIAFGPAFEIAFIDGFADPDEALISEQTYLKIREVFLKLYRDADVPIEVRRKILEASIRAPQDWHADAVRAAYNSNNDDWKITALFCMGQIRGFEDQILESLNSSNPDIHYEAVRSAGRSELFESWSHIAKIVKSERENKPLLLAAIRAVAAINPGNAPEVIGDLIESDDEEIIETIRDVISIPGDEWDDDNEYY